MVRDNSATQVGLHMIFHGVKLKRCESLGGKKINLMRMSAKHGFFVIMFPQVMNSCWACVASTANSRKTASSGALLTFSSHWRRLC